MALTAAEEQAKALGFAVPEGTGFIKQGDDAIRQNAVKAVEYARTAGIMESVPSSITSLDKLLTPGDYQLFGNSDAARLDVTSFPKAFQDGKLQKVPATVSVRKPSATNFIWQELRVWDSTETRIWTRQTRGYNRTDSFTEWAEIPAVRESLATKVAAVNLTTSVNGYFDNANAMNHRVPFKLPVRARRFRLHVASRNDASGVEINDPELRFNKQPVIGKHKLENGQHTGQFLEPPFPASAKTSIPIGSTEFVGEWMNIVLEANTEYLLSFSYYNPNGVEIPSGMSGSYIQAATGLTNAMDVPGIRYYFKTPFQIWLEVEVDSSVKTVGFVGDSLLVGRDSSCPLYLSPAWTRGRREGFIPRMHAIAGGRMSQFIEDATGPRWTRFSALGKCDEAVIQIGSNDFYDQINQPTSEAIVEVMKARLEQTIALARQHIADDVYLCTVLPRNNGAYSEKVKTALRDYNAWVQTLPFGAKGCFDWAGAISDRTGDGLEPRYVAEDQVHLNNAGYAAVAGAPLYDQQTPNSQRVSSYDLPTLWPELALNYRSKLVISGNCASMTLNGRAGASGITAGKIATLPAGTWPLHEVYGFGQSVGADGLQVRTNGDVYLPAVAANAYFKVSVSWAL